MKSLFKLLRYGYVPSYAYWMTAISIFFICNIAFMARPDFSDSVLLNNSISSLGDVSGMRLSLGMSICLRGKGRKTLSESIMERR